MGDNEFDSKVVRPLLERAVFCPDSLPVVILPVGQQSVLLASPNPNRKRIIIHNDSFTKAFISFGFATTTDNYSIIIYGGKYYESHPCVYLGSIYGIRLSGNDPLKITEFS